MKQQSLDESLAKSIFRYSYQDIKSQLISIYEYEHSINGYKHEDKYGFESSSLDCLYRVLNRETEYKVWRYNSSYYQLAKRNYNHRDRNNDDYTNDEYPEENEDIISEETINQLEQYRPDNYSSKMYSLLFSVAVLYIVDYYHNQNSDIRYPFRLMHYCDSRFSLIVRSILRGNRNRYSDIKKRIRRYLMYNCFACFELKYENVSYLVSCFLLIRQINNYLILLLGNEANIEKVNKLTGCEMSIDAISWCRKNTDFDSAVRFFPSAIHTSNNDIRAEAFSSFCKCALSSKKYQWAYDIAVSWINSKLLDCFLEESVVNRDCFSYVNRLLSSDKEVQWRINNPDKVANIYSDLVMVCRSMYNMLYESSERTELLCLANYFIALSLKCDPTNVNHQMLAGLVYSDNGDHRKAIAHFGIVYNSEDYWYRIYALRCMLLEYTRCFTDARKRAFEKKSIEYIAMFQALKENRYLNDEDIMNGRDLFYLLSEFSHLEERYNEVVYFLLDIENSVSRILDELRIKRFARPNFNIRKECFDKGTRAQVSKLITSYGKGKKKAVRLNRNNARRIAYYTRMENIKYLFETKLENDGQIDMSDRNSINTLTVMHARYMNDPEEGLVLLRTIEDCLPRAPEVLRDELYDQKFVFLKSFTGLIDELNMWTLYGGDTGIGKDCNGCCVCIAPETFDKITESSNAANNSKSIRTNDDYHLYSIAYMNGEDIIVDGCPSEIVKANYDNIRNRLLDIKECLHRGSKKPSDKNIDIVANCLVRIMGKIMFLFKDSDYQLESECRIIITRDVEDRGDIKETEQTPPKLYINPEFQVYPEQIILGPKVDDPDYWIPHLQLELSKISDKWLFGEERDYHPIVRKSNIKIR